MKQLYRATLSILVEGIYADSEAEADDQIHNLIDQLGVVKTDLEWQHVEWTVESTIEYDTDYSGNLPKDDE